MEIRPFASDLAPAWNAFNAGARNGHFIFDRGFMEYHADRFDDASLVALSDGEIVGLLPANRVGDTVHSHQGLTFGGLVVDAARTTDVMQMLDACTEHWKAQGAARLVYKPLPWIYHRRPAQEDLYWLFRRDARLVRRDVTAALRLDRPGPVSQRRRRGAGKAERAGVRNGRSERFDDFWALLDEVLTHRHEARPVHSLEEIRRLAALFPTSISLHTAEDPGGEVLAGVVLFSTGDVDHVQYMATGEPGRAAGALDGLLAHLIASSDAAWFDFGTSNLDQGRVLNEGLVRQKEEFGASIAVHDGYEIDLA